MKDRNLNINNHDYLLFGKAIKNRFWLISIFVLTLLVSSCTNSKYSQCDQISYIAKNVVKNNKELGFSNHQTSAVIKTKNWLSAANTMKQAADNMMELKIDQIELINYRNKLASIYSIYAQATYDAVKANENKDLEALRVASSDAAKAGEVQRNLVREINIYCTAN